MQNSPNQSNRILPPLVFPGQTNCSQAHTSSVRERERERERERKAREREKEGGREKQNFYACKGAHTLFSGQRERRKRGREIKRGRVRKREGEKEGGRERGRERKREM